jgi:hypothetical protein
MNAVVTYLKNAFDGRNLEADAEKLGIPVEKLKSIIEEGALISAKFAKELEAKINSIRAVELLDAQLEQAKAEAKTAGSADAAVAQARVEQPAAPTPTPVRQGRQGQGSTQPSFGATKKSTSISF